MLQLLGETDIRSLPLDLLNDLANEELCENPNKNLHIVIHHTEIPRILNASKDKAYTLGFDLGSERYSGASIFRSVTDHTDLDLPEDQAFLLIVTHVEGGVRFHVGHEEILFKEGQVLYFDPHIIHGVNTNSPNDNATVLRVTVKKR